MIGLMKRYLCNIQDYLKLTDDQVESSPMSEFWRLPKLATETPKMFSVNLLRAFKEAHPQKEFDYEYDNVLIERFVEAQSEDTRNHIKENTLISKSTGQRIAYEAYVKLAEQFENNKRKRQQNYEKMQQKSNSLNIILINLKMLTHKIKFVKTMISKLISEGNNHQLFRA